MYRNNPTATKPEIRMPDDASDRRIVALEAKLGVLSEKLNQVIAENDQLRRTIRRTAQDITLLTNALSRK